MSKLALIMVGAFMLVGVNQMTNSERTLAELETVMAMGQYEILARNAALAGLDRVKQQLADDFQNYSHVTGTNDGISYVVNAVISGTIATVLSTGTAYPHGCATNDLNDEYDDVVGYEVDTGETTDCEVIEFNVQAKFKQRNVLPTNAPPFMRYAIITDEELVLQGNILIEGDADNELNSNIHTNDKLKLNGNAALTRGFGTFKLTAVPSEAALADNFVPIYNPGNAPTCFQTDEIVIPTMDPAALASTLVIDSTAGPLVISNDIHFGGTREDPYIWHVEGGLLIQGGGIKIDGYHMFLVEGGVDIRGNVEVGNSGYDGGEESSIAFYTSGGVELRGGVQVWAQIYSNAGVEFYAGTPAVYGSITTKGEVDFRGDVNVYYKEPSPGLTQEFQDNIDVLKRIAYSEW